MMELNKNFYSFKLLGKVIWVENVFVNLFSENWFLWIFVKDIGFI